MALNAPAAVRELSFEPIDNSRLANFVGPMDENLRQVEQRLGVEIRRRGGRMEISGTDAAVADAKRALTQMYATTANEALTPDRVHLSLQEVGMTRDAPADPAQADQSIHTLRGGVRGRGPNQRQYLQNIRTTDLTFGIGPAGT